MHTTQFFKLYFSSQNVCIMVRMCCLFFNFNFSLGGFYWQSSSSLICFLSHVRCIDEAIKDILHFCYSVILTFPFDFYLSFHLSAYITHLFSLVTHFFNTLTYYIVFPVCNFYHYSPCESYLDAYSVSQTVLSLVF